MVTLTPIGVVHSQRTGTTDDDWDHDATDGTPVFDIKPVMRKFLPREPVRQPAWAGELMADYWLRQRK